MTTTSVYTPSPQQAAVYQWAQEGQGSALVEATAGAGKTSTLIGVLPSLTQQSVFFGAFNKAIVTEIQQRVIDAGLDRPGLVIATTHSAGFAALRKVAKRVRLDDRKTRTIIRNLRDQSNDYTYWQCEEFLSKLVGFAKQYMIMPDVPATETAAVDHLVDHFGLTQELPDGSEQLLGRAMDAFRTVFAASYNLRHEVIDFNDMIYLPLVMRSRFDQYDVVMADEVQDYNPARIMLCRHLLRPGGRFLGVGDRYQSIYGFAGADSSAMGNVREEFNCKDYPLTVSYRCPRAVVEYARQWATHIEAAPNAPKGAVEVINTKCMTCGGRRKTRDGQPCPKCAKGPRPWFTTDQPNPETDVIICRFNRPLVATAYAMLRFGVKCKVEGRDIGNGLIKIVRSVRAKGLDDLEPKLAAYLETHVQMARTKGSEKQEQTVKDCVETIRIFLERTLENGGTTIDDLIREIESLFADGVTGALPLCSGHKAKGREWENVYWLQMPPIQRQLQPWELQQENNLNYVITTRAKRKLKLVPQEAHEAVQKPKEEDAPWIPKNPDTVARPELQPQPSA